VALEAPQAHQATDFVPSKVLMAVLTRTISSRLVSATKQLAPGRSASSFARPVSSLFAMAVKPSSVHRASVRSSALRTASARAANRHPRTVAISRLAPTPAILRARRARIAAFSASSRPRATRRRSPASRSSRFVFACSG
jgi:hypothetical protein